MTSKKFLMILLAGVISVVSPAIAQEAAPAPAEAPVDPGSPVAPQPQIKSQEEAQAFQAIQTAADPNSRIQAVDALIEKFPDSELKPFALQIATVSAQMMNDYEKMMIYGERTLESDEKNYMVMLAMANGMAQKTQKFDLDKEEKLGRATDYAKQALGFIDEAPRPNPQVTDEMWEQAKNDFRAQAYEALGMVALVREDWEAAVEQFKQAVDVAVIANPASSVRLAAAYVKVGNPGEAIATLDSVLAQTDLHPQIRQIAEAQKAEAKKLLESK